MRLLYIFYFIIFVIQSALFSYFVAYYFKLKNKTSFLIIVTLLQTAILTYAFFKESYIILVSISIMGIILMSLYLWTGKVTFDYIYMTLLYNSFIIVLSLFSSIIITAGFELLHIENSTLTNSLARLTAISLQTIITVGFIKKDICLSTSFNLKEWGFIIILDFTVLAILTVNAYALLSGPYNSFLTYFLLLLSFFAAILYRYTIHRLDELNKQKIEYIQLENMKKNNQEKVYMISQMRYEIESKQHRIIYLLKQMENYIDYKDYDSLKQVLNNYIDLITQHQLVCDTKNPIFDCLFSIKINEMIIDGKNLESSIFITQKDIYNDIAFIELVLKLLDYFIECETIFININEIGPLLNIRILYRDGTIDENHLTYYLVQSFSPFSNWNLKNHPIEGLRLSINLEQLFSTAL